MAKGAKKTAVNKTAEQPKVAVNKVPAEVLKARELVAQYAKENPSATRMRYTGTFILNEKAKLPEGKRLPLQAEGVLNALRTLKGKATFAELEAQLKKDSAAGKFRTTQEESRIIQFYRKRLLEYGCIKQQ